MSEDTYTPPSSGGNILRYVVLAVAVIYIAASLYLIRDLRTRLGDMEQRQKAADAAQKEIQQKLHLTSAGVEALGSKVGMTQEELAKKTAELRRQQQSSYQELTAE